MYKKTGEDINKLETGEKYQDILIYIINLKIDL